MSVLQKSDSELGKGKTVLIVDDDPTVYTPQIEMIESIFGCKVLTVQGEDDALKIIQKQTPKIDLLSTDISLGDRGSGRSLVNKLRKPDSKYRDLPIILHSGLAQNSAEESGITITSSEHFLTLLKDNNIIRHYIRQVFAGVPAGKRIKLPPVVVVSEQTPDERRWALGTNHASELEHRSREIPLERTYQESDDGALEALRRAAERRSAKQGKHKGR